MDLEIGRARLHYGCGPPNYGREVHCSQMRETFIGSYNVFDIMKTNADFYFMHAENYFKIGFAREVAL